MKVCIAGGGRVGMYLAQSLLSHRHKVTIIEPQEALCRTLADTLDIPVICGDSLSFDTLRTADVASCDAFVAVTNTDEILLPEDCQFAGKEIKEIPMPGDAILVSITRDTEFIIPHGSTVLLPWDRLLCLTQDDTLHLLMDAWGLSSHK